MWEDILMEYGLSILMFCFSGALLLYAGLLTLEKRRPELMIPRHHAAKIDDPIAYARRVAKIVVVCAAAPLLAGLAGLFAPPLVVGIVFVVALILAIWLGVRLTGDKTEERED